MTLSSKQNRAFTLMELAVVLCVAGLVLGAMWAVASSVLGKSQLRVVTQQVMSVVQNVRDFYGVSGASPGAAGVDVTSVVNARRLIPVEMRLTQSDDSGSAINHAMASSSSGTFKVIAVDSTAFRLELQNLSKTNCVNFLMSFPFISPELGVKRVAVSSNVITVDLTSVTTINANLPFKISTASSWCSASSNTLDIDFSYRG